MRRFLTLLTLVVTLAGGSPAAGQSGAAKTLDIYYIDAEGGQSTLFVSPSGQVLLVDTGSGGDRDPARIFEALKAAGVQKIDHMLLTHYHGDHYGGLPQIAKQIPIAHFYDHGQSVEMDRPNVAAFAKVYTDLVGHTPRTILKPGDKIPLAGTDVTVLVSSGNVLKTPIAKAPGAGRPNPACAGFREKDESKVDPDNHQSVGFVLTYGQFRTVDMGDFTWNREGQLMCPNNPVGTVDVYLTTHHGLDLSGAPAFVHAIQPRVAIMNNGVRKGGNPQTYQTLESSPGLEDLWQLHWSYNGMLEHNTAGIMIANIDAKDQLAALVANPPAAVIGLPARVDAPPAGTAPVGPVYPAGLNGNANHSPAYWIKVSAKANGSFTVTNSRNGYTKTYAAKQ